MNGAGGADAITYANRSQPVFVTLDTVADDGEAGEADRVNSDIEDVIGGSGNDTIIATAVENAVNVISGGAGMDRIKTREGTATSDRVNCGPGNDTCDIDGSDMELPDCEAATTIPKRPVRQQRAATAG